MAISFIGATSGTGSGSGASLPGSYADGDIIIAFGYNRSSTTAPGAPTGGTYTFILTNPSGFTNRATLYYKVISGDTTFPGFSSGATHYALAIYRGQNTTDPIGGSSSTTNNTNTISYADFAEEVTDGTSWIIGCGAHRNDTSGTIVVDSPFTSRTLYIHQTAPNSGKIGIGDIADITSWSGDTCATGGAANGHASITIELLAEPGGGRTATLSATEADDTVSAAGVVAITAAASITEASDTVSATGVLLSGISAVLAVTEQGDTVVSTAVVPIRASFAATEEPDTVVATIVGPVQWGSVPGSGVPSWIAYGLPPDQSWSSPPAASGPWSDPEDPPVQDWASTPETSPQAWG